MKKEIFNVELDRIQSENVRISTENILDILPDYLSRL